MWLLFSQILPSRDEASKQSMLSTYRDLTNPRKSSCCECMCGECVIVPVLVGNVQLIALLH